MHWENQELERREQEMLKAGDDTMGGCYCGCRYADSGGSSTVDNGAANRDLGFGSPGGGVIVGPDMPVHGDEYERPLG